MKIFDIKTTIYRIIPIDTNIHGWGAKTKIFTEDGILEQTAVGLTFNVLTDDDPFKDPDLFFYNPDRVLEICKEIDKNAKIVIDKTSHVAQIHVFMYR